jgi:hypothetical protein
MSLKRFKGTQAEYQKLHNWVKKHKLQTECCQLCKETKFVIVKCRGGYKKRIDIELSNISGEYKRDVNDYQWVCHKCHLYFDGSIQVLVEAGKKYNLLHPENLFGKK